MTYPQPAWPTRLAERIEALWGDRLRLRWSLREGMWHVEQKLEKGARQLWPSMVMYQKWEHLINDDFVRRRDGFTFVLRISPRSFHDCPACGKGMEVPPHHVGVLECLGCKEKGKMVRTLAGYWDLGGDAILDELRKMDPNGIYQKTRSVEQRVDDANYAKEYWAERTSRNEGRAILMDAYMDAFPKAGFSSLTTQEWRMG